MAYMALRPIKIGILDAEGKQIGVKHVKTGEIVEDAASWSYPVLISHLNLHLIEWIGEELPPHTDHKRAAVIDMAAYRNEKVSVPTKGIEAEGLQRGATPGAHLSCPKCERKFSNKGAVSNHLKHKHPETSGQVG